MTSTSSTKKGPEIGMHKQKGEGASTQGRLTIFISLPLRSTFIPHPRQPTPFQPQARRRKQKKVRQLTRKAASKTPVPVTLTQEHSWKDQACLAMHTAISLPLIRLPRTLLPCLTVSPFQREGQPYLAWQRSGSSSMAGLPAFRGVRRNR